MNIVLQERDFTPELKLQEDRGIFHSDSYIMLVKDNKGNPECIIGRLFGEGIGEEAYDTLWFDVFDPSYLILRERIMGIYEVLNKNVKLIPKGKDFTPEASPRDYLLAVKNWSEDISFISCQYIKDEENGENIEGWYESFDYLKKCRGVDREDILNVFEIVNEREI